MIACRLCVLIVLSTLAGCQTPGLEQAPPTSRYLQRDLTVAWPEREYWSLPPAPDALVQPPATPSPVAAALACRRGAC